MFIGRQMDKQVVVHMHSRILCIKKNAFESALRRWMKLEPIIKNKVSQKEKHQYSMLTYIYVIYKHGSDDSICETAKETQI